jgi:hypothetical protein
MAQAVEHLLCKCEALGSNHRPTKKKKRKKEITFIYIVAMVIKLNLKYSYLLKQHPKS